jgi:hypothetical protein
MIKETILFGVCIFLSICCFFGWLYWTIYSENKLKENNKVQSEFEYNIIVTIITTIFWSIFYYIINT